MSFYEQSLQLARAQQDGWRSVVLPPAGPGGAQSRRRGGGATTHLRRASRCRSTGVREAGALRPVLAHMATLAVAIADPYRALCLAGAAIGLREKPPHGCRQRMRPDSEAGDLLRSRPAG